jgi:hypothetical protein
VYSVVTNRSFRFVRGFRVRFVLVLTFEGPEFEPHFGVTGRAFVSRDVLRRHFSDQIVLLSDHIFSPNVR